MKNHFRTIVQPSKPKFSLSYQNTFLLAGSCFSENIGKKLKRLKFDHVANPLGISYNPISIHESLLPSFSIEVEERKDYYFSYQLHSAFNNADKKELRKEFRSQKKSQKQQLDKANGVLILTYGTAWVYELNDNKKIVHNCQKQDTKLFNKRILSIDEIVASFNETKLHLEQQYPEKLILLTVSPVRHLKDGVRENQLSKSILHLAIDKICKDNKNCFYFPSYEIMMDDLRDYRFYKDDYLHPNSQAVDYIWQCFSNTYFSEETIQLNAEIEKVNASILHRAFRPKSEDHQSFLEKLYKKIELLQEKTALNFREELAYIKRQIV